MSKLIDGRKIAEKIKDNITKEIFAIKKRPNLAIILFAGRSDSELYVSLKEKEAKKVGIDTHLYKMASETSEEELLNTITYLNNDDLIDGILVQLPLPKHIDTDKVIRAISPKKDIDGFHPENIKILDSDNPEVLSPVYGAIIEMLNDIKYELKNKKVVIISNSNIFGDGLVKVLQRLGASVQSCHPDDKDLKKISKTADVLISAVGKPRFIKKDFIKKDSILIDIGITKENKSVRGDFDFEDVENYCAYISPVPGGVGPLTIAMTFQNTLNFFKKKQ
ncbi:bifunctional methylenetetrahydrofolate dehydrogenase/methenyltetrahydrofolate cyclohydrolase [Candidatus Parcubacteria bacterium]|nr:MAG: bifunctional methylenetetrahydrofolate dehydrogenase/methenyltetrahydrofolate cyclohydrolase [Candidatus Parcubacteria bacterium]